MTPEEQIQDLRKQLLETTASADRLQDRVLELERERREWIAKAESLSDRLHRIQTVIEEETSAA